MSIADAHATDASPPITTASPEMGTYRDSQSVTLTCSDESGSGCANTYYCLESGCTPTTVYNGPVNISFSTMLRFYSTDVAGNSQPVQTVIYTIVPAYTLTVTKAGTGSGTVTGPTSIVQPAAQPAVTRSLLAAP